MTLIFMKITKSKNIFDSLNYYSFIFYFGVLAVFVVFFFFEYNFF